MVIFRNRICVNLFPTDLTFSPGLTTPAYMLREGGYSVGLIVVV